MTKIAVFGSAFNPPSLGHKSVIDSLSHFDKVLLLPSISHAWGKKMLDYQFRCKLVDAFIADLSNPKIERSNVEEILYQPGQSVTTFDVLAELQKNCPSADITFVIGPDNLFSFAKFHRAEEILSNWSIMACPERVTIRSTNIRDCIARHETIEHLTTPSVCQLLAGVTFM